MGKIFTFDEIHDGLVPSQEDFVAAKMQTLEALAHMATVGDIAGAMIFGSVAKGTPSERSDFDLLVITEEERHLREMRDAFDAIYQNTHVGIEPIIIPKNLAERGFHTMDESFFLHLQNAPVEGNVVGQHPLGLMSPFRLPLTKVHEQYLIQKLRRLREGIFTHSEADEYRVLQRALEAPINTGRRTLQALDALGAIDATLKDDGKAGVRNLFRDVFNGTSIGDGFNNLLQQDEAYSSLLKAALSNDISRQDYEDSMHAITDIAIPQAINWVSEVSTAYISALEGNKIGIEGRPSYGGKER